MNLSPDAFLTDAYGWLTNQTGHVLLGLVLTAIVAVIMRAVVETDMRREALLVVSVAYLVVWEGLIQTWGAGFLDALADTAFVALGGIIGVTAWGQKGGQLAVAFVTMAGIMAAGVARRWKR
jgi:hypothetical protein